MYTCEKPPAAPLVFTNWPPKQKSQAMRYQLLNQLRSSGRIPPMMMMIKRYPQRLIRPMKLQAMPHYMMKKHPAPLFYKPTLATPVRVPFRSSPAGPHTNEYIYEMPYTTAASQTVRSIYSIDSSSQNYIIFNGISFRRVKVLAK